MLCCAVLCCAVYSCSCCRSWSCSTAHSTCQDTAGGSCIRLPWQPTRHTRPHTQHQGLGCVTRASASRCTAEGCHGSVTATIPAWPPACKAMVQLAGACSAVNDQFRAPGQQLCQHSSKMPCFLVGLYSGCECCHQIRGCLQGALSGATGVARAKSGQLDRQHSVVVLADGEQANLYKHTQQKYGCVHVCSSTPLWTPAVSTCWGMSWPATGTLPSGPLAYTVTLMPQWLCGSLYDPTGGFL
jgi:hypothetical protein